ncbi:MAG: alpha/beta hydrolase [Bacteroidota bacterium]
MKVYFISGLGADERVFQRLELPGIEQVHLGWITPLQKETFTSYAGRMTERITDPGPIIVGLSFGGMLAVEISKIIPVKKLILISSAKGEKELPAFFKMGRTIPLHKIVPTHITGVTASVLFFFLGVKDKVHRQLLQEMVNNCPAGFIRWAMDTVVHWKNTEVPANLVHIHGNTDWLLPYKNIQADHTIHKGGHSMIMSRAKEISALLQKLIPCSIS